MAAHRTRRPSRWGGRTIRHASRIVALVACAIALVVVAPGPLVAQEAVPSRRAVAVQVAPADGLAAGHPVTVTATGLAPNEPHVITQCGETACQRALSPPPSVFVAGNTAVATSSAEGALTARIQVERTWAVGPTVVDCAIEECRIDVVGLVGGTPTAVGSAPIAMTATGTYQWPRPTLDLDRTSDLISGQRVVARGTGYDWWNGTLHWSFAWATASVEMCRAVAEPTAADCETPERTFDAWASGGGDVVAVSTTTQAEIRVRRHLALASGPWDCARQGCTLALSQGGNPVSERVRVRFAPEWAPWSGPEAFMTEAVEAVLGRRLTAAQRSSLRSALGARTTTGTQALVDAASSSAHDATVGEVVRLYRAYFGRVVDAGGLGYWVDRMRSGTTALQVARLFGGTPEFRLQYDSLSDAQVVTRAYERTLGRAPSAPDLEYWTGRLAAGLTRVDLVSSFARSPELRAREAGSSRSAIISWTLSGQIHPGWSPHVVAEHVLATVDPT